MYEIVQTLALVFIANVLIHNKNGFSETGNIAPRMPANNQKAATDNNNNQKTPPKHRKCHWIVVKYWPQNARWNAFDCYQMGLISKGVWGGELAKNDYQQLKNKSAHAYFMKFCTHSKLICTILAIHIAHIDTQSEHTDTGTHIHSQTSH